MSGEKIEEQFYEAAPFGHVLAQIMLRVFEARAECRQNGLRIGFERYKIALETYYLILPPQLRPKCDPRRLRAIEELDKCLEEIQALLYEKRLIFPRAEFHRVEVGVNE